MSNETSADGVNEARSARLDAAHEVLVNELDSMGLQPSRLSSFLGWLSLGRISGIYMLILLVVVFSIWLPGVFPTVITLQTILSSQAVVGIAAVGLVFVLAAGAFDLSIGYTMALVGIVVAKLFASGMNWEFAIVIGVILAACIGGVNGIFVEVIGIDSFIATLAMGAILDAIAIGISGDTEIVGFPQKFLNLLTLIPVGIPIDFLFLLALSIISWFVLTRTSYGRRLYSVGFNREAARLAGVATRRSGFIAFVITAIFAGIAGIVLLGVVDVASPDIGSSYLIPVFAAALLGATQLQPGRPNVWGALIAAYLLATGTTGLQLAGASSWAADVFNGVALLFAVGLGVFQGRFALWRRIRARSAKVSSTKSALQ
ncbi:MAG: ABC transporter permease [Sulfobacillus sp.]